MALLNLFSDLIRHGRGFVMNVTICLAQEKGKPLSLAALHLPLLHTPGSLEQKLTPAGLWGL